MATPEALVAARVFHILGVVIWIGGVAFVTTVLLPTVRSLADPGERITLFEAIESRFSWQARGVTLITGLSGLFMLHGLDAWGRYLSPSFWWIHLMTFVWLVFTLVLFILEPLILRRWFQEATRENPDKVFSIVQWMHWILLSLSLIAIVGAVAGTHGYL